jgi:uncharacterized integral membrane protein
MRTLMRIVLAVFIILFVTFAVANRSAVTLNLWPLPFTMSVPLFAAILGAFAVGLLIGTGFAVFSRQRLRMRVRSTERRAERAERAERAGGADRKVSVVESSTGLPARVDTPSSR